LIAWNRSPVLLGVLVIEVLLGVPITIALGSFGVYFLITGIGAFTSGILGVTGVYDAFSSQAPRALLLAPVAWAIGALAFAVLMAYLWLIAITLRALRR
jgi:hypothetical protein